MSRSRVVEYVTEEVWRQGHDVRAIDGMERVQWMLQAWLYAIRRADQGKAPTRTTMIKLGKMVEQNLNRDGLRKVGVQVGGRICPPPAAVHALLVELEKNWQGQEPLNFYRQFELVHPFVDGNGRVGKILLNWKNGTLLDPIFPPADFWGKVITNP